MNNHSIYPGYYGEVHRQIYEHALRVAADPQHTPQDPALIEAVRITGLDKLDLGPGPLEKVLDIIFGTYRRTREEHKPDQEKLH